MTELAASISNDKLFDQPVYNYSRDFPFLWEEIRLPIPYAADRERAEAILLAAAERHTVRVAGLSAESLRELERRYVMRAPEMGPRVYYRLTDNWLELTVRFIVEDHGIREIKDAMSRDILRELDCAGITIASATFEVVGVPSLEVPLRRK